MHNKQESEKEIIFAYKRKNKCLFSHETVNSDCDYEMDQDHNIVLESKTK